MALNLVLVAVLALVLVAIVLVFTTREGDPMTTLFLGDGRTYTLTDAGGYTTIGDLADAVAADAHLDGAGFSFKVGGVVIAPETLVAQVALNDANAIELVDVSGHQWLTPLAETGTVVTEPEPEADDGPFADDGKGDVILHDADADED